MNRAAALRARREALASRAEAERERLAGQFEEWGGGLARGLGVLGAAGRYLPIGGIAVGLGLAAIAFLRVPAIRTAVLVAPTVWHMRRGIIRVVGSFRRSLR